MNGPNILEYICTPPHWISIPVTTKKGNKVGNTELKNNMAPFTAEDIIPLGLNIKKIIIRVRKIVEIILNFFSLPRIKTNTAIPNNDKYNK